jgi:signal transduction histidine kinase
MWHALSNILNSDTLSPHGICLLWRPDLVWLHLSSDAIIGIAYFSIPAALAAFVAKRKDVEFGWVFWAFAIFILSCGTTHFLAVWTLFVPDYGLEGLVKAFTAVVSVVTAIALWWLLPKALAIPSTVQLQQANEALLASLAERDRALRANKELEEFAYAASHDLKAPLRVIDNATKWLEEDLQEYLSDETREHLDLMRKRVGRMEKLLDDLLNYSRIGRTADARFAEVVAGDALIDNVLELLGRPPGFAINVGAGFAGIRVCRMPLQQILMNLVSNAIKHHGEKTGRIDLTVEDRGTHYAFAVKDDGPGIPTRFHEQIFRMFQTLKPRDQVEGSGMGLALVRKNVEAFGGSFDLDSGEGKGSTFRFTWPKQQQLKRETA